MEYLGQTEQEKLNAKIEKSSKKSSKKSVSEEIILQLCKTEKSLKEITEYFGYKDVYKFKNNYLKPLLDFSIVCLEF